MHELVYSSTKGHNKQQVNKVVFRRSLVKKKKKKKQGLLKNWPRMTGPTKHGVFKVISWMGIWHTNFEGGNKIFLKKLASSVRQGLQGMGCSKLLAEGG